MQITFLVGNGFDISCGLRTSYRDFYKWYVNQENKSECIRKFKEDIIADKEIWSDFELALGQYTSHFSKETVNDFIACYEDAHTQLMEYLDQEVNRFDYELNTEMIQQLRQGIEVFYSELQPEEQKQIISRLNQNRNESNMIQFISYNYTKVLDTIVSQIFAAPLSEWRNEFGARCIYGICSNVIHAHGTLERYPIFGVNDESQIANKELLSISKFAKLMIKPESVKAIGETWHNEIKSAIKNSSIICIFGMSLGTTDSVWFESIMNWLREDKNRHLIIFWEKNKHPNKRSCWEFLNDKDDVIQKITNYSDCTSEEIENLSMRIHGIMKTDYVLRVKLNEKQQ